MGSHKRGPPHATPKPPHHHLQLKFEQKIWRQFGFGSLNRTQLLGGESGDEALQDLEGGGRRELVEEAHTGLSARRQVGIERYSADERNLCRWQLVSAESVVERSPHQVLRIKAKTTRTPMSLAMASPPPVEKTFVTS
jgi:hypothetical protein